MSMNINSNIMKCCIYLLIITVKSLVYWLIVKLKKKKTSIEQKVEQLGFFKQGKK